MNAKFVNSRERLGDYAYQAVQKHFKKSIKHEKDVLADQDPEPLHQMRVGMRRLRTALLVFDPVLKLPKTVKIEQIKKIAHRLGTVRDLDVLKAKLEERYRPDLEGKERKQLDKVLDRLEQQRRQFFAQTEQTLRGDRYRQFKQGFLGWLDAPRYDTIAALPMLPTLPDLLLPLISHLLLHPGWLIGTESGDQGIAVAEAPGDQTVKQWLDQQSEPLHDLRKQMKQVRYQTEFFTEFYDADYQTQVEAFQAVQEVLGEIQDYTVLQAFLTAQSADWRSAMPTLAQRLEHEQISLWKTWQPYQQQYLDASFRQRLRELVLHPRTAAELSHTT
jgi:CHAD domain-containing protein